MPSKLIVFSLSRLERYTNKITALYDFNSGCTGVRGIFECRVLVLQLCLNLRDVGVIRIYYYFFGDSYLNFSSIFLHLLRNYFLKLML